MTANGAHRPLDVRGAEHMNGGALLDAEGAAALLNVPKSWVLAQARRDAIPHLRLGHYVRFDGVELLAWAHGRARGPRRRTGAHPVSANGNGR